MAPMQRRILLLLGVGLALAVIVSVVLTGPINEADDVVGDTPSVVEEEQEEPEERLPTSFAPEPGAAAIGPLPDSSGIYLASGVGEASTEWCENSTRVWQWRAGNDVVEIADLPGDSVGQVQELSTAVRAFLVRCDAVLLSNDELHAVHLVERGVVQETLEVPVEMVHGLWPPRLTTVDGAVVFGTVHLDADSLEFSVVDPDHPEFEVPGSEGLLVSGRLTEGLIGCETDGVGYEAVVLDRDGEVRSELWAVSGGGLSPTSVQFASKGRFLADNEHCNESSHSMTIGEINAETGAVEFLADLCRLPELLDNDMPSYGPDVAVVDDAGIAMWKVDRSGLIVHRDLRWEEVLHQPLVQGCVEVDG